MQLDTLKQQHLFKYKSRLQNKAKQNYNINKANKVNINNFINTKLNTFSIALVIVKDVNLLVNKYLKDSQQIAKYLTILQRLVRLTKTKF